MTQQALLDAALQLEAAGYSVVPARPDGSKAPIGTWRQYMDTRPSRADLTAWLADGDYDGIGIVCGAISGNLEMLELEGRAVADGLTATIADIADASGLGDLWRRVTSGYTETTPTGGIHILYRVDGPVAGNTKLARRPGPHGPEVLAETRGEGGYVIVAPSGGRTHPSEKPWQVIIGGVDTVATVTGEERDALHVLARSIDAMPTPELSPAPTQKTSSGDGPGVADDYNARTTWDELLTPRGWVQVYTGRDGTRYWRRPGKDVGVSATTGRTDGDNLFVFSTSTAFDAEKPYSRFAAYALLEHGGDMSAAAKHLYAEGYGDHTQQGSKGPFGDIFDGTAVVEPVRHLAPVPDPPASDDSDDDSVDSLRARLIEGGTFILDAPDQVPTVWGDDDEVYWAEGEALMIVGPPGVGKTTLTGQLVRARLGLTEGVLGASVAPTTRRLLYLAMDRPAQIARSLRRTFRPDDRAILNERLVVWKGPPPADIAKAPETLIGLAHMADADTIVIDSLKDAAIGLGEDEVAAGYNRARQMALSSGVQVLELHHLTKRGPNGQAPKELADVYGSAWLTAGAGSVVLIWGAAGDPIVELRHLKQPAAEVGPLRLIHDHDAGTTEVFHGTDLMAMLQRSGYQGLSTRAAAQAMFDTDKPSAAEREKARRRMDKLVQSGLAVANELPTGRPGKPERTYFPAPRESAAESLRTLAGAVDNPVDNKSRQITVEQSFDRITGGDPQITHQDKTAGQQITHQITQTTEGGAAHQITHAPPPIRGVRDDGAGNDLEIRACRACGTILDNGRLLIRGRCSDCISAGRETDR